MLRGLEQWLEFLLDALKGLNPKDVEEAEKIKESERRDKVRKAKKEEQKREYEERLAKSSARAKAEVVKNVLQTPSWCHRVSLPGHLITMWCWLQ
jgi:hypothetical protein